MMLTAKRTKSFKLTSAKASWLAVLGVVTCALFYTSLHKRKEDHRHEELESLLQADDFNGKFLAEYRKASLISI